MSSAPAHIHAASRANKLGILGGGQLGRMLIYEAQKLNVPVAVLDPDPDCPCASLASPFVRGSFREAESVLEFGRTCEILTIEIEDVHTGALRQLQHEGIQIFPDPDLIETIQDKGLQKEFYHRHGIPTADFLLWKGAPEFNADQRARFDFLRHSPLVQKMRKGGYDGKGVQIFRVEEGSESPLAVEANKAAFWTEPSVLEAGVDIAREVSVIVARSRSGEVRCFPPVEMHFHKEAHLVDYLFAPSGLSAELDRQARDLAVDLAKKLELIGVMAVEMFLDRSGRLLVNEAAPRPHNSGHQTIESNYTSQYQQHLRCVLGLPLGNPELKTAGVMVNILGEPGHSGPVRYKGLDQVLALPGTFIHLYGKTQTRPYRKMGHITVCAPQLTDAEAIALQARDLLRCVSE